MKELDNSLRGLYEQALKKKPKVSPGQRFIRKIAALTHRTETTVRMWIYGYQEPDDLVKAILAEYFKLDADVLFPPKTKKT